MLKHPKGSSGPQHLGISSLQANSGTFARGCGTILLRELVTHAPCAQEFFNAYTKVE